MDPALLAVWVLRLLFLGLLYLFLAAVVRVLLRDLRAATSEPGTELGRLTVLASPSGEPGCSWSPPSSQVHALPAWRRSFA